MVDIYRLWSTCFPQSPAGLNAHFLSLLRLSFYSLFIYLHLSCVSLFLNLFLSFLPGVFLTFSASVSVLGEKTEMLEWNQPPLLPCVLVCLAWVFVCERAHAWASSAVKVRLIHWLQLRGAERLAEFNSNLFTLLRPANADGFCLRNGLLATSRGLEGSGIILL